MIADRSSSSSNLEINLFCLLLASFKYSSRRFRPYSTSFTGPMAPTKQQKNFNYFMFCYFLLLLFSCLFWLLVLMLTHPVVPRYIIHACHCIPPSTYDLCIAFIQTAAATQQFSTHGGATHPLRTG